MKFRESRYFSGEKVCPGDYVTWAGRPGRVIFVMGSPDNPPGEVASCNWLSETEDGGFMLELERVGRVFENLGDEDLQLARRHE